MRDVRDHRRISEATAGVWLLCVISVLCIFAPAALEMRADPALVPAVSKPAWYFLALYKFAQFVPTWLGIAAPALLFAAFAALPWLDRSSARTARGRLPILLAGAALLVALVALAYAGWAE